MIKPYLETTHEAHEGNLDQKQISTEFLWQFAFHLYGPSSIMGANPGEGYRGYCPSKNLSWGAKYCI